MNVTIDGNAYELNIGLAEKLGVLKKIRPIISEFNIGDVFSSPDHSPIVIIRAVYPRSKSDAQYNFVGLYGDLIPYSNFPSLLTKEQVLEYLNNNEQVCIGNVNEKFRAAVDELVKNSKQFFATVVQRQRQET